MILHTRSKKNAGEQRFLMQRRSALTGDVLSAPWDVETVGIRILADTDEDNGILSSLNVVMNCPCFGSDELGSWTGTGIAVMDDASEA